MEGYYLVVIKGNGINVKVFTSENDLSNLYDNLENDNCKYINIFCNLAGQQILFPSKSKIDFLTITRLNEEEYTVFKDQYARKGRMEQLFKL